ncbi:hypothetical protein SETIT_4G007300v2 [Setaria italica]|uniref:Pectinesterase inhibitor domain-containing protein n=1 Tax=Setaria italica TaxID=4555 RepID=A0A368QRD9_SETIT|nr:hypothetical protein SETIT_4G007300v2 [Setaria italica]
MAAAAAAAPTLAVVLCAAAAFFATAHARTADGDLIAKTCANATSHGRSLWPFEFEEFCKSRLRMDKRSAAAKHPRDLALIAMDLTQRAVADADAKVDGLLRSGAGHLDNCTALILRNCRLNYAAVASSIPVCRAMAEEYEKPDAANKLAPSDHFECSRRLRRNTDKCLVRIFRDDELRELLFRDVGEAGLRVVLVQAMQEEMLGVVNDDDGSLFAVAKLASTTL